MPPLTALEVMGTRVEGAVLVVQLRPTMKQQSPLKTGAVDVAEAARVQEQAAAEAARATAAAAEEARRAAMAAAAKEREAHWQRSMSNVHVSAARRQAAKSAARLAEAEHQRARSRWSEANTSSERARVAAELKDAQASLDLALVAQRQAEQKVEIAQQSEARALRAKDSAEKRLGSMSWQLQARYGSEQFRKGLARARKVKEAQQEIAATAAPPAAADAANDEVLQPPTEPELIAMEVERLQATIGPETTWAAAHKNSARMIEEAHVVEHSCERLIDLCATKGKNRQAASNSGVFDALGQAMKKYDDYLPVHMQAFRLLEVLSKKAERDQVQEPGAACFSSLADTIKGLMRPSEKQLESITQPAIAALHNLTRNNRETTLKLARVGGKSTWLDDNSNVVPPSMSKD